MAFYLLNNYKMIVPRYCPKIQFLNKTIALYAFVSNEKSSQVKILSLIVLCSSEGESKS